MDEENLHMQIRAVEREIAKESPQITIKNKSFSNLRAIFFICLIVITLFTIFHRKAPEKNIEADANHIINQAHHEVMDYLHQYGKVPDKINNPALEPYITIEKKEGNRFNLICKIEDNTFVEKY